MQAVALLTAAGDSRRARITVGGLSRSELRHGRWESARVLIGAERVMGRGSIAADDCDMFLRLAAAEYHLGRSAEWRRALDDARATASRASDSAIRQKLLADIDAVMGSLIRPDNPRGTLSLLSAAINFQESADRAILLPELYLQRGRANRALGQIADAQRDTNAEFNAWNGKEHTLPTPICAQASSTTRRNCSLTPSRWRLPTAMQRACSDTSSVGEPERFSKRSLQERGRRHFRGRSPCQR